MYNISFAEFVLFVRKLFVPRVFFEIGALDGLDSITFKAVFPNARVIAFEALSSNYDEFLAGQSKIEAYKIVVFKYDGRIVFYEKDVNGIHSVFDRGRQYGTKSEVLSCKRVDTLCKELEVSFVDVVKIDVEGATFEVLEGFGSMLNTVKVLHIETEDFPFFQGQKLDFEVTDYLNERGFRLVKKEGCEIVTNLESLGMQYDSIWVRV